jgi:hypothetical protein
MSNMEGPMFDFDPDRLPSNWAELNLLELGVPPEVLAEINQDIAKTIRTAREIDETIVRPYLERYGVQHESELPPEAYHEMMQKIREKTDDSLGGDNE